MVEKGFLKTFHEDPFDCRIFKPFFVPQWKKPWKILFIVATTTTTTKSFKCMEQKKKQACLGTKYVFFGITLKNLFGHLYFLRMYQTYFKASKWSNRKVSRDCQLESQRRYARLWSGIQESKTGCVQWCKKKIQRAMFIRTISFLVLVSGLFVTFWLFAANFFQEFSVTIWVQ